MRTIFIAIFCLFVATSAMAQPAAASYEQRATLGSDTAFLRRVQTAVLRGATTVIAEASSTTDHAVRLKLAGWVVREPEFAARRFAAVISSLSTVTVMFDSTATPQVYITATDTQLQTSIDTQWTRFAEAFTLSQ